MKRSLLIVSGVVSAVLLAAAIPPTEGAASAEATTVPMAGAVIPRVTADDIGFVLGAADASGALDPAATVFGAAVNEPVRSAVHVDPAALSSGTELTEVALAYQPTATPEGASVTVLTVGGDHADEPWIAGSEPIERVGISGLEWNFDRAGDYEVTITARIVTPHDSIAISSEYRFTVLEAAGDPVEPAASASAEATPAEAPVRTEATPAEAPVRTADGPRPFTLTSGHIDLFEVTYDAVRSELALQVKDDTRLYEPATRYRTPSDVRLHVDAELARWDVSRAPASLRFLAVDGDVVYQLPQTQNQSLPWPGWSTERLAASLSASGLALPVDGAPVELAVEIDGPGNVFAWQTGTFGAITNRFVDTVDPAADVVRIAAHAHVHSNWVFTRPGEYRFTVTPTATTTVGSVLTGTPSVYAIRVAPIAEAAPAAAEPPTITGDAEPGGELSISQVVWRPTPHTTGVQWMRDGEPIEAAQQPTYRPTAGDVGHVIAATVEGSIASAVTAVITPGVEVIAGSMPDEIDENWYPGDLDEHNAGDVTVVAPANDPKAGETLHLHVGQHRANEWLSIWLHSDPRWLGWAKVGIDGISTVKLPADTEAGTHRLVALSRDGDLVGWARVDVAKTPPPPAEQPEAPPVVAPPPASKCVAGSAVLSSGHIDYASRIIDGKLESLVGDDTGGSKVYRQPSGTILWLKPSSRVTLPSGFDQVGPAGSTVWQVPQTQDSRLIWLGWSTEALNAGNVNGPVRWTLDAVSGPGRVTVYLTGSFGGIQQVVLGGAGSVSDIPLGVHAHANWAFTAEGVYRLKMTQSATLANGVRSHDTETLTVVVGDVDPATASTGGSGCGAIAAVARDRAVASDDIVEELPTGAGAGTTSGVTRLSGEESADAGEPAFERSPAVVLLAVLLGMLVIAAAIVGALWWRRRADATR